MLIDNCPHNRIKNKNYYQFTSGSSQLRLSDVLVEAVATGVFVALGGIVIVGTGVALTVPCEASDEDSFGCFVGVGLRVGVGLSLPLCFGSFLDELVGFAGFLPEGSLFSLPDPVIEGTLSEASEDSESDASELSEEKTETPVEVPAVSDVSFLLFNNPNIKRMPIRATTKTITKITVIF